MKLRNALVGSVLALGISATVPVVPKDMHWSVSYETIQFNTPDGDLALDEYAVADATSWYVREKPKSESQWGATSSPSAIKGKHLVSVRCEKCAFYNEFTDGTRTVRVRSTAEKYDGLRDVRDFPQPKKKRYVSILSARNALAAIAHDADSNTGASFVGASSASWSHTSTGSNGLMVISMGGLDTLLTDIDITAASYNSVSATSIRRDTNASTCATSQCATEIWYLLAPTTGSSLTVSITLNGTVTQFAAMASTYTGVKQSGQPDANNGANGVHAATPSVSVTTSADNSFVVDVTVGRAYTTFTVGSGQTQVANITDAARNVAGSYEGPKTPAGAVTMNWTVGGSAVGDGWTISAASFAPFVEQTTNSERGNYIFVDE